MFKTLEVFAGYRQIKMGKFCKEYTIFITSNGSYRFEFKPFGLKNAPSTFAGMINAALGEIRFVQVYLDDFLISLRTMEVTLKHLSEAFSLISRHPLKQKVTKFDFNKDNVELFGRTVSKYGGLVEPKR